MTDGELRDALMHLSHSMSSITSPPPPHPPSPYVDLHGDKIVASVSLNLQDLRKNQDDATLGLNKTAIERNVVHERLEDERPGNKLHFTLTDKERFSRYQNIASASSERFSMFTLRV